MPFFTLKVGNKEYVNMHIDSETVQEFQAQGIDIENIVKEKRKEELSQATDRFFYTQAKQRGGYINMGEIEHDSKAGDPDAQFLDELYDALWEKEEELESQIDSMALEELLKIEDMDAWAKPHYDAVVAELENAADSTTDNTSEG
ncbi:hypothetical protein [Thermovibrio ammonificans]